MVTDFKTTDKDSDLFDTLLTHFGKTINLARIKFLSKMLKAIVILRTVNFAKLATAFGGKADALSSMRHIQRFMANYDLDLSLVARLIFKLLPHKRPYILSMDRTNWQFGSFDINALVLAVTYQGVAFPLPFRLLPKKGNSNTQERIDLMERYIALFGKSSIDCLVADREFVGGHWIGWLNDNRIRYHIRIRENFWVHNPHNGKDFKAFWAFLGLGVNTLANRDVLQIPKIQRVQCRGYSSCRHPKDRKTLRRAHNRFLVGLSRRYFQRPIHQAYQDA